MSEIAEIYKCCGEPAQHVTNGTLWGASCGKCGAHSGWWTSLALAIQTKTWIASRRGTPPADLVRLSECKPGWVVRWTDKSPGSSTSFAVNVGAQHMLAGAAMVRVSGPGYDTSWFGNTMVTVLSRGSIDNFSERLGKMRGREYELAIVDETLAWAADEDLSEPKAVISNAGLDSAEVQRLRARVAEMESDLSNARGSLYDAQDRLRAFRNTPAVPPSVAAIATQARRALGAFTALCPTSAELRAAQSACYELRKLERLK